MRAMITTTIKFLAGKTLRDSRFRVTHDTDFPDSTTPEYYELMIDVLAEMAETKAAPCKCPACEKSIKNLAAIRAILKPGGTA